MLWEITCHMHHTVSPGTRQQWIYPNQSWYSIYQPQRDARLSWPVWWLHPKIVYPPKTVTCLRNNQAVSRLGLDPKSDVLTTTLSHHSEALVIPCHAALTQVFKSILEPSSCLFTLLPNPRDPSVTTRLRSANKFPRLPSRTRKYQTFISDALSVSICIIIQTSILVFCFYFFSFLWLYPYICSILHCDSFGLYSCMYLLCYLVFWPPNWINVTTWWNDWEWLTIHSTTLRVSWLRVSVTGNCCQSTVTMCLVDTTGKMVELCCRTEISALSQCSASRHQAWQPTHQLQLPS